MGFSATLFLLPPQYQLKRQPWLPSSMDLNTKSHHHLLLLQKHRQRPPTSRKSRSSILPVARLFGPAIFEASKLKVLFVGLDEEKHPGKLPRTYTLTHSDITSKLTLAISNNINRAQLEGWYNRLQRDEVVAEWKKVKGKMSLHVHCHISGGHFLLNLIASLRFYIFCKELPVVLKAFVHGDERLFNKYPELEEALVWVYFDSNLPEFNRVECWGPLRDASSIGRRRPTVKTTDIPGPGPDTDTEEEDAPIPNMNTTSTSTSWVWPQRCQAECDCCFPPHSLIPWPQPQPQPQDNILEDKRQSAGQPQQ